jgi:hypothetical protein
MIAFRFGPKLLIRSSLTASESCRVSERCKRGLRALAFDHPMIIRLRPDALANNIASLHDRDAA